MQDMDASSRFFTLALGISIVVHAVVLSLHFKFPDQFNLKSAQQALDVVLVNSKSVSKPTKAQALAQANLDGGGNVDDNRRASTFLPAMPTQEAGTDLREAKRRQQQLEAEQAKLMTQLKSQKKVKPATEKPVLQPDAPQQQANGVDLSQSALAMARMEAELARRIEEYNKRPRKAFAGARTQEYRLAQYLDDWRQKIERIGSLNYPVAAKGRLYGSLVVEVIIKPDGTLAEVRVDRSSGHKILDDAAVRIVKMGAPYGAFPPNVKDIDMFVITRTWTFMPGDKVETQ